MILEFNPRIPVHLTYIAPRCQSAEGLVTPAYRYVHTHKDTYTHTHAHLILAVVFRSCIEDKSKSDCRVKGPPPALRVRLQLRGHRQLEREDQTASLLSWCCRATLSLHTLIHTHAQTSSQIQYMKRTHLQSLAYSSIIYQTLTNVHAYAYIKITYCLSCCQLTPRTSSFFLCVGQTLPQAWRVDIFLRGENVI